MTNTNTAANTEAQAPAAAEPMSNMAHSRILFAEIYAPGYKLRMEGAKSQRSEFVKRAMAEFGATKAGAATYFQNLSNAAKGEPLYKYTSSKSKKADTVKGEGQLEQTTTEAKGPVDQNNSASEGAVGEFRWTVSNEAGEEVASFPIRKTAIEYAKANGLHQGDRNIAPKAE